MLFKQFQLLNILLMQIQKHLFRISQRALKNESAAFWWSKIFQVFCIFAVLFVVLFIYGHAFVLSNNDNLTKCIKASNLSQLQLGIDQFYYVMPEPISSEHLAYYNKSGKILSNNAECSVILNKNYTQSDESALMFGWDQAGMFMNNQKKSILKYDNVTFFLKQVQPLRKYVYNFNILTINQILDNKQKSIPFSEKLLMIKSKVGYFFHESKGISTLTKIWYLCKVIICFLIISIVTSLYIYGTIVAAPAVILLILKCCKGDRLEGINDIFKLFPWIGIHAIIRDTSTTPIIKQSTSDICKAILFYFFFLYLVYYATIVWIDKKLFITHIQAGLQELIFGYIALTEFVAIVFMRTRTFIKYYPSFHSLIIIAILYYCQVCDFGLKKIACYAGFSLSIALLSWMILNLQIPAHTTWDENSPNTPKEERPRIGYFPLFNMTWIKSLPDQWTMMMPLFGREHFTARQLALVDRNNELLGEALGNQ